MSGLGFLSSKATMLFCDKQSCITLTKNPRFHDQSKHIEIRYHFAQEKKNNLMNIYIYCSTNKMLVDSLTMLPKPKHDHYGNAFGIQSFPNT